MRAISGVTTESIGGDIMAWLTLITGLLRGKSVQKEPAPQDLDDDISDEEEEQWDEHFFDETCRKRDAFWSTVGQTEGDVLAHLISPSFTGGADWPTTRQAYRVVRRDGTIIIATDGLSDPFRGVAGGENGFELELFIETPDIDPEHAGEPGDISNIGKSWAFEVIQKVASTVAEAGGINGQLDRYSVLSVELPGVSQSHAVQTQVPMRFITQDDCIGVLIGAPKQDFPTQISDTPLSPVRVVPVTIITAAELEHIRENGANERGAIANQLARRGPAHVSTFMRAEALP